MSNEYKYFFNKRDNLIIEYRDGIIDKREFLKRNFNFIKKIKTKPCFDVSSYEEGIFGYQYYNSIAKYYKMMMSECRGNSKRRKYFMEQMNINYHKKDNSILKLLQFLEYKNMEAYHIHTNSDMLRNKLYEIVLNDYDFAIFHSKSEWLLVEMKKADIFKKGIRTSLIDNYINEKYWNTR